MRIGCRESGYGVEKHLHAPVPALPLRALTDELPELVLPEMLSGFDTGGVDKVPRMDFTALVFRYLSTSIARRITFPSDREAPMMSTCLVSSSSA